MHVATGIGAAFIMHAEMFGVPAWKVTAITDSHSVSTESMQSYGIIMAQLRLDALDKISSKAQFKPLLREANRSTQMYC